MEPYRGAELRILPSLGRHLQYAPHPIRSMVLSPDAVVTIHSLATDIPSRIPQLYPIFHYRTARESERGFGGFLAGFFILGRHEDLYAVHSQTVCPAGEPCCYAYEINVVAVCERYITLKPTQIRALISDTAAAVEPAATTRITMHSPCATRPLPVLLPSMHGHAQTVYSTPDWHDWIRKRIALVDRLEPPSDNNPPIALLGCALSAIMHEQTAVFAENEATVACQQPTFDVLDECDATLCWWDDNTPTMCFRRFEDVLIHFADPRTATLLRGMVYIPLADCGLARIVIAMVQSRFAAATEAISCEIQRRDPSDEERVNNFLGNIPLRPGYPVGRRKRKRPHTAINLASAADIFVENSPVLPPCISHHAEPIITRCGHMKHTARWIVAEYAANIGLEWADVAAHIGTSAPAGDLREMKANYDAAVAGRRRTQRTCDGMGRACPYPKDKRYLCYGNMSRMELTAPHEVTLDKLRSHEGDRRSAVHMPRRSGAV
jgi:hypothetical protein